MLFLNTIVYIQQLYYISTGFYKKKTNTKVSIKKISKKIIQILKILTLFTFVFKINFTNLFCKISLYNFEHNKKS